MKISQKESFKDLTTFKVGGHIKYFVEIKNQSEIDDVFKFARKQNLQIFVIGGGSDFLASDDVFNGLAVKYLGSELSFEDKGSFTLVTAGAGLIWDKLVSECVKRGLAGLECLSGIPGTVGGSPVQNLGAYGSEMSDTFFELIAFDIQKGGYKTFSKEECKFGYRDSIFKNKNFWQKYLIVSVSFKLKKETFAAVSYDLLKNELGEKARIKDIRETVIKIRNERLENPKVVGNAGSFFKNPVITKSEKEKLEKSFPDAKIFPFEDKYKVSAAWLIDKAGWKGKSLGDAAVSSKHALILVNKGGATSSQIYKLSQMIINDVFEKFAIKLEREVMLVNFSLSGKKIAVLGLGIEGKDAINYLLDKGASVTLFDRKEEAELDFSGIDKTRIKIVTGENYLKGGLKDFDLILRSPGVYRGIPEIKDAEKHGVKITSAIKIFFEESPAKIIGVTGTKGKGTTSTLIYEILKASGREVFLSGNIGKPFLELLPKLTKDSWVVMEMSSFQLIDMDISPQISVVLNITLDHMDWHKSRQEYVRAKENIVRYQTSFDYSLLNEEYETSKNFEKVAKGKIVFFSKKNLDEKYKKELLLRGEHNLENIAAAVLAAKCAEIDEKIILQTVKAFKGLEHRLELVGKVDGVSFYNDSFATGPQPTMAAINSFSEPETIILGGSDKGLDYGELRNLLEKKENLKNLVLIGDIGEKIGRGIRGKNIVVLGKSSMKKIVEQAKKVTPQGGVVILSPAAASFDMFKNYKDRGNQFKDAVSDLGGIML